MPEPEPDPEPTGRKYTAPGVTVYYEARRCVHFAECVRGLPAVFDVNQRPWVQPEHADPETVAEVTCASTPPQARSPRYARRSAAAA